MNRPTTHRLSLPPGAGLSTLLLLALALVLGACSQTAAVPATSSPASAAEDTAQVKPLPTTDAAAGAALERLATSTPDSYPPPETAEQRHPYPDPVQQGTATPTAAALTDVEATATAAVFFPIIGEGTSGDEEAAAVAEIEQPTSTALPTATATTPPTSTPAGPLPPTPTPTPFPPVDFESARADLTAAGQDLAYNKVGLHVTFLEDSDELDTYMERLDAAGVPMVIKSVDNAEPVYKAQELMKQSGVDHVLVYRSTAYDVPNYDTPPVQAAEFYWEQELAIWPPELDPGLVWFETMNELDKNRSEWLAQFSLRTAQLALRDGYKWAGFSWASGEPEPADWESPAMLELLRLVGEHPDQLAIALHEYSYLAEDIGHEYPYKVGRFQELFRIADKHGIPRPTVLITEWGWTYNNIPSEREAMEDIDWAARLYAAYPQVLGAAIWNLGKLGTEWGNLDGQVGDLVDPLMVYTLTNYFPAPFSRNGPISPESFPPPGN